MNVRDKALGVGGGHAKKLTISVPVAFSPGLTAKQLNDI